MAARHPHRAHPARQAPWQNACVERHHRTARHDGLAQPLFASIAQARESATRGLWAYPRERPNMAIGGITLLQKLAAYSLSTLGGSYKGRLGDIVVLDNLSSQSCFAQEIVQSRSAKPLFLPAYKSDRKDVGAGEADFARDQGVHTGNAFRYRCQSPEQRHRRGCDVGMCEGKITPLRQERGESQVEMR
jgi:hypothetical protein